MGSSVLRVAAGFWSSRCFLPTISTPLLLHMWPTCSPKPMPRLSSWQMNSDRYTHPRLLHLSVYHPLPPPTHTHHVFFAVEFISGLMTYGSFQELINRHLITMAQIDQSENPGKASITPTVQWVVVTAVVYHMKRFRPCG